MEHVCFVRGLSFQGACDVYRYLGEQPEGQSPVSGGQGIPWMSLVAPKRANLLLMSAGHGYGEWGQPCEQSRTDKGLEWEIRISSLLNPFHFHGGGTLLYKQQRSLCVYSDVFVLIWALTSMQKLLPPSTQQLKPRTQQFIFFTHLPQAISQYCFVGLTLSYRSSLTLNVSSSL